ncbi:MAG: prolipoprotein diacylglyceryl transferase family protein [Cyclobacteriaceae bacterium]
MNALFTIDIQNPGRYYALFYFLAFLIGLILLIKEGRKRKFPVVPWLLVITTAFLFFMIGSQAIKFNEKDWLHVFRLEALDQTPGRSVLGGLLLVVPGLLMAKYALKFRYNMMDTFAWVIPVGMTVQRLGCLMAGCCYGKVTTMPWGIKYGVMSHAFQQHAHENLLPASTNFSLAIHPTQLYDMIGCVIILLVLTRIKKHLKVSGNLFLASILLYSMVRFANEFFRVPSSGNGHFMGLTFVQVCILLLIPLLVSIILVREKRTRGDSANENVPSKAGLHYMIYFIFITFLFLLFSRWLSPLEIVTLNLVLLPTLTFIAWQVFKSVTVPKMRWVTGSLMAGSMVMMSQTLPEKSKSDSTKISYNIFSMGTFTGSSQFVHENQDCSGNVLSNTYLNNVYKANALGISRVVQQSRNRIVQFGIDGFSGTHTEEVDGQKRNDIALRGIHPYFQYDAKIWGFGFGIHAGRLSALIPYNLNTNNQITSVRKMSFAPSLYFRVGYINRFFGEMKLAQQFPTNFPSLGFQTNLGIGFGKNNGGAFRIGTASFAGLFLAPSFPVGKNLVIEPYLGFFNGFDGLCQKDLGFFNGFDGLYQKETNFTGAFSVRYKFNLKDQMLDL